MIRVKGYGSRRRVSGVALATTVASAATVASGQPVFTTRSDLYTQVRACLSQSGSPPKDRSGADCLLEADATTACTAAGPGCFFISDWDVSGVDSFRTLFSQGSFNQDIGNWDTSSATDMGSMFEGNDSFNQDISNWDTAGVADMEFMFTGASAFNQDIGSWDVSAVDDMQSMFHDAESFDQNLEFWDVSSVVYMPMMFKGAVAFDNDGVLKWDTSTIDDAIVDADSQTIDDVEKYVANMFFGATAWLASHERLGGEILKADYGEYDYNYDYTGGGQYPADKHDISTFALV